MSEYFFSGRPIALIIHLDSIGLFAPGLTASEVEGLAVDQGFLAGRWLGQGMYVAGLPEDTTRLGVAEIARELISSSQGAIPRAGLVVRVPQQEDPSFVTDEFIVEFRPGVTPSMVDSLNAIHSAFVGGRPGLLENDYVLLPALEADRDALALANAYQGDRLTVFSHPNFISLNRPLAWEPNDRLYPSQWHLENTGQTGGVPGADISAPDAWQLAKGTPSTVIAIVEPFGTDTANVDIHMNLWANPSEVVDQADQSGDEWGKPDDIHGWNFAGCVDGPMASQTAPLPVSNPYDVFNHDCGSHVFIFPTDKSDGNHGEAVAGLAAARGDNLEGVTGVCPFCTLMLIRTGHDALVRASAIRYAWEQGAAVVNHSYTSGLGTDYVAGQIFKAAEEGRGGLGTPVVWAVPDEDANHCKGEPLPKLTALDTVISVGASTDHDTRWQGSGRGPCLDVLAPGMAIQAPGPAPTDQYGISTADRTGSDGYNDSKPLANCSEHDPAVSAGLFVAPEPKALDYTRCFNGTSAAAPIVSGIVALMLSINPDLDALEVQDILKETADKVDAVNAGYDVGTGHSNTHGFGRVNASAAVQEAAARAGIVVGGSPPGPAETATVLPVDWSFDYVSSDHHLDEYGVRIDGESYDPLTGSLEWTTELDFADKNNDDDYHWEVGHAVLALNDAVMEHGGTGWMSRSTDGTTHSGSLQASALVGLSAATVVLKGWGFDFSSSDHHIKEIGVRIRDVAYDAGAGTVSWETDAWFSDKNGDDNFQWRYQWQVIGLEDGAVSSANRQDLDGGGVDMDQGLVMLPSMVGFESADVLLQGWRFEYDSKDHHINESRWGIRNVRFNPPTGRVSWSTALEYSDKNFDDDYVWEYDVAIVAHNGPGAIAWWGGPLRDNGGGAEAKYNLIIPPN